MNNEDFFVSVIIPVYKGEAFLLEAVESIQRQHYDPLEIIIIDDGSTDSTAEIAVGLKGDVHYIYQPNSGPSAARNRGLRIARGNVIGFLDVDDLWTENKMSLQLEHLAKEPSLEIVLGLTQRMQMTGFENGKVTFREWADPEIALHLGSALFRKSVFDKVGLFDESMKHCEDWDWFMRAKELHIPMMVYKEVTYYYRRHDKNITNDTKTGFKSALTMLRQSLHRRRDQGNGEVAQLPGVSDFMGGPLRIFDNETERKERNESDG
jgi:glycosyltransferase involved in cell wall biosynthesis